MTTLSPQSFWQYKQHLTHLLSRYWFWAVLAIHLCIILPLAYTLNIWLDEAYSLNTTSEGIQSAIEQSFYIELQPPLYFVLLNLWRNFSGSIFWARLLSVIFSALTVWIAPKLSRRYAPSLHPAWVTMSIALHPYLAWAALEIRPYSLGILVSALLLLFFHDGFLSQSTQRSSQIAYGIAVVVGVYVNYILVLVAVANGLALLCGRRDRFWRYMLTMLAAGLVCTPLIPPTLWQLSYNRDALDHKVVPFFESIKSTVRWTMIHTASTCPVGWPSIGRFNCYRQFIALISTALLGLGWLSLFRRKEILREQILLFASVIITIAILTFIAHISNKVPGMYRYTFILFVSVLVAFFSIISSLKLTIRRQILSGWIAISFGIYLLTFIISYGSLAKDGDWQRVANYIQGRESESQPILIFHPQAALPLEYYYQGSNQLVPLPKPIGTESFNPQDGTLSTVEEIEAAIPLPSSEALSLWVVSSPNGHLTGLSNECSVVNLKLNCQILETYLDNGFVMEEREDFYNSTVRKFKSKE